MTWSLDKGQEKEKVGQKEGRYNVRAVDRALCILSVLSDGKPRTLTELSEEIGINSSTTFRFLATLASTNYVERDNQSAKYRLGLACLELARAYHAGSDIRQAALPELEQLRDDTTETVHLGLQDGGGLHRKASRTTRRRAYVLAGRRTFSGLLHGFGKSSPGTY
jgi:DNA-binding IclR family transcriptional regulator